MPQRLSKALLLSASALAVLAAPLALPRPGVPFFSEGAAYAGGKGGGGGGGGNSDHGNSGKSETRGNSGGHGKSAARSDSHDRGNAAKRGSAHTQTASTSARGNSGKSGSSHDAPIHGIETAEMEAPIPHARNMHARLAGLNSLRRNANGLMNSSDPRMEGIREFVQASADLETAQAKLEEAMAALGGAENAYDLLAESYGLIAYDGDPDAYADLSVEALAARLDELNALALEDPDNVDLADEIAALGTALDELLASEEYLALQEAGTSVDDLETELAGLEDTVSDDALREALLLAANENRLAEYGDEYLSDDLLEWARKTLGVGDNEDAVDDLAAGVE